MGGTWKDWTALDVERHNGKVLKFPASQLKATDQNEVGTGGIQEQIEDWLKTQVHRAWWTRSRTDKATTNRIGTPDFVGCFAGKFFGLEVKRPGKKPTTEQLGELAWIRKAGGIATVVFSKDEAVEFLLKNT